jgi:glycosyltransferase involved in cell wall biosynthesis
MAESMACGTPVIGLDLGSVCEVVSHDETGFVVGSVDEAVEAVSRAAAIDRSACRIRVERRFSVDAMVDGYLDAYRKILGSEAVRPTGAPQG